MATTLGEEMHPTAAFERVRESKDRLRESLAKELQEIGLAEHFDIASIALRKKTPQLKCPPGQVPSWESTTKPDGTVVYEWVCKQET